MTIYIYNVYIIIFYLPSLFPYEKLSETFLPIPGFEFLSQLPQSTHSYSKQTWLYGIQETFNLSNAGTGVFLKGSCKLGQVVCLYPGTVYLPSEPLLFASLANQYILKCYDGTYIDGKLAGLSGYIHRSLYHRENWPGATQISDMTWMTDLPRNPLAIGQIVNNGTKNHPANVYYQEIDLPMDFPRDLRQWIPNIYWCNMDPFTNSTRVVALVALRDIENEEVLSTYMDAF
ncbi:unnamed protein product [Absidia cylindrospora]